MIGTRCESHGLCHLRPPSHVGVAMESPSLHHAQFGHPSLAKLQQLVLSLSKLSSLLCESCQLGKHSRSSFPCSVSQRDLSSFALVHSDISGPSRVKSTLGFQYFVTFIDDYSRCIWLYLMKNRSELFSIFQSFFHEIKTQFGISIRNLGVIMVVNIFLNPSNILWLLSAFFIKHHALIHPNKMEWLSARIDTLLKQLAFF